MSAVDELMVWVDRARRELAAAGIEVPGLPPHLEAHAAEVSARMLAVTHEPHEDHQPTPESGQNPGGTS